MPHSPLPLPLQFALRLRAMYPATVIRQAVSSHFPNPTLEAMRRDPSAGMRLAGLPPDPWQIQVMRSPSRRMLFLCSRQVGKSTTAAALALRKATLTAESLTLLLSPGERQSGEIFRKVMEQFRRLGRPIATTKETALTVEFRNGSRIVALPENEEAIRGYSGVGLLVIDEASRVTDDLYRAVRPMLATSGGTLVGLSTPFGKRGWFFDAWTGKNDGAADPWERYKVTAAQCPRITAEFLAEERAALGERWYNQEYFCTFEDAVDAVFSQVDIQAAVSADVTPLFG